MSEIFQLKRGKVFKGKRLIASKLIPFEQSRPGEKVYLCKSPSAKSPVLREGCLYMDTPMPSGCKLYRLSCSLEERQTRLLVVGTTDKAHRSKVFPQTHTEFEALANPWCEHKHHGYRRLLTCSRMLARIPHNFTLIPDVLITSGPCHMRPY